jgi:hypothetical protein
MLYQPIAQQFKIGDREVTAAADFNSKAVDRPVTLEAITFEMD